MPGRTPSGVQRPPAVSGRKVSVHWCLRGARVAPASGWLPKNPALSLAMSRAWPASIRKRPGRNQDIKGLAVWTLTGPLAGPRKPAARPLSARSSPEHTESVASWTRSVLGCGVSEKSVSPRQMILTEFNKSRSRNELDIDRPARSEYSFYHWRSSRGGGGKVPGDQVADDVRVFCPRQRR